MKTEFVRNLNCNYLRIFLEQKPEEKKYQYCILNRGGIKGLLPCSLRYIDEEVFLYYDITSRQNMKQMYDSRAISRGCIFDLLWSIGELKNELERFLLDVRHVLFLPEHIFMDLETRMFSFLYIPYYEGEQGYKSLLEFLAEHIDYGDEELVECVYHMLEQYELYGDVYFQKQIFEDAKILEKPIAVKEPVSAESEKESGMPSAEEIYPVRETKKSFFTLFDNRRKKAKSLEETEREDYRIAMREAMAGRYVAEDLFPEMDKGNTFGKTLYIEETAFEKQNNELCLPDGKLLKVLDRDVITIGKRKEEADVVLPDPSVSRLHARITREGEVWYIEDLNSTNGTYKNGLRLMPCERRILEEGDEIRAGRVQMLFR